QAEWLASFSQRDDISAFAIGSIVVAKDRIETPRFDKTPLHVAGRNRPALIWPMTGDARAAIRAKFFEERIVEVKSAIRREGAQLAERIARVDDVVATVGAHRSAA